jgi:hypothetical protein
MINKLNMKQYGVIVYSDGMNIQTWVSDARKQGYTPFFRDGYCELWR